MTCICEGQRSLTFSGIGLTDKLKAQVFSSTACKHFNLLIILPNERGESAEWGAHILRAPGVQQSGQDLHFWRLSVFNFHSSIPRAHIDIQPFSVYWCRKAERKLRKVTDLFTQPMLGKLVIFSVDKLSPPSTERTSSVHGVWEGGVIFTHRAKLWGSFVVAGNWE